MNTHSKMTAEESAVTAELWTFLYIWLQLQTESQQEQIQCLKEEVVKNEATIQELREREREKFASISIQYDGILRWTIPEFQKSPPVEGIQSEDFFSVEGHRMSAKALVNGGGKLSISLTVSEWPCGGLQPFPYRGISFQIRSPRDNDHYEEIMKIGSTAEDGITVSPQNPTVSLSDFVQMSELHSKYLSEGGTLYIMIALVKDLQDES